MAAAKKTPAANAGPAEEEPGRTGAGSSEVEIARRSQDVDAAKATEHRKVFVVPKNPAGKDFDDAVHAANIDGMRQGMIAQGLRPTEDGRFVEARDHSDGQSVCLVYACRCVPASEATLEQNQVRVTVADTHALRDEERETAKASKADS